MCQEPVSDAAFASWCREGELNPQGTKYRRILSPLRLPVPPSRPFLNESVNDIQLLTVGKLCHWCAITLKFSCCIGQVRMRDNRVPMEHGIRLVTRDLHCDVLRNPALNHSLDCRPAQVVNV